MVAMPLNLRWKEIKESGDIKINFYKTLSKEFFLFFIFWYIQHRKTKI